MHPNAHRMHIIAHGTPGERKIVLHEASEHFIESLKALLREIDEAGALPSHWNHHLDLLHHPEATMEDKKEALTGGGFMDFLEDVGKGLLSAVPKVIEMAPMLL